MADISKIKLPDNTEYEIKDAKARMVILRYGISTWNDFITAYQNNCVVYCRASSNSNPATGSQTRLAFMAYVSNADTPTNVEFQYYRSMSKHTDAQQGDQVFVYKLTNANKWTVTTRNAFSKVIAGTNLTSSFVESETNSSITLSADYDSTVTQDSTKLITSGGVYTAISALLPHTATITDTPIASFSDGADNVPVSSLIVDIDAVQDLHGQDAPYPAGGGKNKLPNEITTATEKDVTFTTQDNGKIYIHGTSTGSIYQTDICENFSLPEGNYVFSYDAVQNVNVQICNRAENIQYYIIGSSHPSKNITVTSDMVNDMRVRFIVQNGKSVNGTTGVMIRLASETDTSYHPYSNICPISGWNGSVITRCGTNIWDGDFESGKFNISTGAEVSDSNFIRSKNFIKVKPDTVGYVKFDNPQFIALFYDKNKTYTTHYSALGSGGGYISIPSDAHYMKFYSQESTNQNDISINYPTETDEDYHAYVGSKYQTYFEGLMAGTYGFVDLGGLAYTYETGTPNVFRATLPSSPKLQGNLTSSIYVGITSSVANLQNYQAIISGTPAYPFLRIRNDDYTDASTFKTAMSGVYLIYELATPTTPSITQEQINMLISAFNADLVCVVFGQEVYGAHLNVTTGELVIAYSIVDLGSLAWNYSTTNIVFYADFPSDSAGVTDEGLSNSLCDTYAFYSGQLWAMPNNRYMLNTTTLALTKRVAIKDTRYTDTATFKTAMNGVQLVYELATPITVQLTPTEVRTLLNDNNIFADTGDINELVYFKTGCESITELIDVMHDDSKMSYSNAYYKKTCNQLTDPGIYYNIDTTGSPAEGYSMTTLITTYNCQILVYLGLVVNTRLVKHHPISGISFSPWMRLANEDDLDGAVIPYNAEYPSLGTIYDVIESIRSPSTQTVTLAANSWDSSTHLITVSVTGVTSTSVQDVIGLPATSSANISNNEALQDANIMDAGQSTGSLTFYAETVPTTDLQIRVIVRG